MKFIGIIPSRFASTRFPGKPLADINGKTMIQRVYEQVSKALDVAVVATDDERIQKAVADFGGKVVLTSQDHQSGTDRCAEAIEKIREMFGDDYDVVINIQGDEPFIQPQQINALKDCFADTNTHIATLIKPITQTQELFDPNKVKVVVDQKGKALYFSRSPIPYIRKVDKDQWLEKSTFYKHIGMYAYRYEVLKQITKLKQSNLEISESLEQLRWLENGYTIKTDITHHESIGIDTPQDLERVKEMGLL